MIAWLLTTVRGVCMGIADIIPGVSGGTLALILGIYERFVAALSSVGPGMLRAVLTREFWRRFAAGLRSPGAEGDDKVGTYASHVLFLGFLVVGIGAAMLVGAKFIPTLLDLYPAQMKGLFIGLVLASVMIPYRQMRQRGPTQYFVAFAAAVGTFVVVGLPIDHSGSAQGSVTLTLAQPAAEATTLTREGTVFMTKRHGGESEKREVAFGPSTDTAIPAGAATVEIPVTARMRGAVANVAAGELTVARGVPEGATIAQGAPMAGGQDPALWFIFIAGFIAISAMVLPGISGSFILLMLGLYHYVTFNLRAAVYDRDADSLVVIAIFLAALVTGILLFSRFLNWLLKTWHDTTMAALVGLMIGSLRKLWPFTATGTDGTVSNVMPGGFDATVGVTVATFVVGMAIVVVLERLGRAKGGLAEAE